MAQPTQPPCTPGGRSLSLSLSQEDVLSRSTPFLGCGRPSTNTGWIKTPKRFHGLPHTGSSLIFRAQFPSGLGQENVQTSQRSPRGQGPVFTARAPSQVVPLPGSLHPWLPGLPAPTLHTELTPPQGLPTPMWCPFSSQKSPHHTLWSHLVFTSG